MENSRITHKGKWVPDGQVLELGNLRMWANNCSQTDGQLVTFWVFLFLVISFLSGLQEPRPGEWGDMAEG